MSKPKYVLFSRRVEKVLNSSAKQSLAHRIDHSLRVRNTALKIAKNYKCDFEVLKIACLLHDVDQPFDNKKEHIKKSMVKAKRLAKQLLKPTKAFLFELENKLFCGNLCA